MIMYGQVTSQPLTYIRETESADIRITEGGDTRITNDVLRNVIEGNIQANPTLIAWLPEMYCKVTGGWQVAAPYVKYSGTWQQPTRVYKKLSGTWKRVY